MPHTPRPPLAPHIGRVEARHLPLALERHVDRPIDGGPHLEGALGAQGVRRDTQTRSLARTQVGLRAGCGISL
eukprot:2500818-Prymnesium_polylepis.1